MALVPRCADVPKQKSPSSPHRNRISHRGVAFRYVVRTETPMCQRDCVPIVSPHFAMWCASARLCPQFTALTRRHSCHIVKRTETPQRHAITFAIRWFDGLVTGVRDLRDAEDLVIMRMILIYHIPYVSIYFTSRNANDTKSCTIRIESWISSLLNRRIV